MSRPVGRKSIHHTDHTYHSDENTEDDGENEENEEIVNQSRTSNSSEFGFSPKSNSLDNAGSSTTQELKTIRLTQRRSTTSSPQRHLSNPISEQNIKQTRISPKNNSSKSINLQHYTPESADICFEARACASSKNLFLFIIIMSILTSVLGVFYYTGDSADNLNGNKYITCNEFSYIKKDFPNQQGYLWDALKIGIESVINRIPTVPSVYLLIHHKNYQPDNLVKRIVNATSSCLGTNITTFKSGIWQTQAVRKDHGVIIDKYRNGFKNGGILYIPEINKIPGDGAKALHFICDNISPIHKRVVIFLTLPVEEYDGKKVTIAENELYKIWGSTLKPNELSAIIARVTDQVLWLK